MEQKIVVLKGKTCHIQLAKTSEDGDFYKFSIFNTSGQLVAFCQFSYFKLFNRETTTQEKEFYSAIGMTDEQIPAMVEIKVTHYNDYNINGDTLIDGSGNEYKFASKRCHLENLEILSHDYQGIGLGSTMVKMVESLARKNKCIVVEGKYSPHGTFRDATPDFYKRNGYKIDGDKENMRVSKDLTSIPAVEN